MLKSVSLIFNGVKYYRYPKAKQAALRNYYMTGRPPRLLHREVWKRYRGTIPAGHVVHHIDENTLNNKIGNLELVERSSHSSAHQKKRMQNPKIKEMHLTNLKKGKGKLQVWQKSEAGKRFLKTRWKNRAVFDFVCQVCKKPGKSKQVPIPRFCGGTCKSRNRDYRLKTGKELTQWPKPKIISKMIAK